MENWENKVIADKLNSLQDLPEDYTPNLASKWELIQSGLTKKPTAKKWRFWPPAILIALFFVWHFFPQGYVENEYKPVTTLKAKSSGKNETKKIVHNESPIKKVSMESKPKESRRHPASIQRSQMAVKDSSLLQPVLLQTKPVPFDSLYRTQNDTIKYHTPVALLPARPKRKVFQKDFDGVAGWKESKQNKIVQKTFQVKFNFQKSKESSVSPAPTLRFTQNF